MTGSIVAVNVVLCTAQISSCTLFYYTTFEHDQGGVAQLHDWSQSYSSSRVVYDSHKSMDVDAI